MRVFSTLVAMTAAHQAAAQSGCQYVATQLDGYYRSLGTTEATQIADKLANADGPAILQTYAQSAYDAATALADGKTVEDTQIANVDYLDGMIGCFVGDEDQAVSLNGTSFPFSEKFDPQIRGDLVDALMAANRNAPVIACIKDGC
jgi:flagellar hook-associated protein FlgK